MTALWPWLALTGLGMFHGVNPAMGWLFAVALGLHRQSRQVVILSLVPIALGNALSGHGAGLMLAPALIPLQITHTHGHAGHGYTIVGAGSLWISLAAVGVHTLAMLLVTGVVAVIAYEWLGVGFLRRGWINFDVLWTIVLIATGTLLLLVP